MKAKVLFVFGLLATLFASMPTFAQNAYYFHFKDGSMQVFYTDWVDSMSVSKLDLEGVEHEYFVTQQVWMNDTVFSYALADIDSVNFVTPKTVYQPGVIKLEDGLDRYVVAHDSMTITLDSATPSKMKPHKGDKLVYLQMTEMFPNGFAGEVINIEGNKLECGLVDLSEVFVQYYSTSESSVQTRATGGVKFKGTWEPGAIPIPTDWLGGADGDGDKDLERSCGFSFSNDFSAEITPVVEVRGFLSVTPQLGTYVCVSSTGTYDLNEKIELSGEFKKDFQKDLLSVNIPLNTPLLQAYAKLYGYFRPTISASLSASFNQQFKSAFLYNVCSKMPAPLKNQPLTIRKSAASSSCVGVSLSGDVEAGIGGEIGIKVADKVLRKDDEAKIFAKFEAGAKMEGEVSFTKAELDNATKTTDLYDNLKDKEIKANIVYGAGVGADLELAVLNLNKNFEIGFTKEFPKPFFKRSFVPLFAEKPIVKRNDDRPSVLNCTSSLSNDCLVPVSVGHAVYCDGELVAKDFYDKTYVSQEASFKKYQTEFEGIRTSKKYMVVPLIKLFGFEMMASPSSEVEKSLAVSTKSAQNVSYDSADILGTVKGYDASDERPTVGFYYGTEYSFYRGNGRTVYVGSVNDLGSDQFKTTLSDLQDKTTYCYVAFVKNNNDVIFGDTLSFTTSEKKIDESSYYEGLSYLYQTANGDGWLHNEGWNDTTLPLSDWYGLYMSTYFGKLRMELQKNNLSGNAVIRNVRDIEYFDLSDNNLKSLTCDNCSFTGSWFEKIERNRASSPLNLEIKNSKFIGDFVLNTTGTDLGNVLFTGNNSCNSEILFVNSVNVDNLTISNNVGISGLKLGVDYEIMDTTLGNFVANKIYLTNNTISEFNGFDVYKVKTPLFIMDNCTFSRREPSLSFLSGCSIDEAVISNSNVNNIWVSDGDSSFGRMPVPAATIKTLKLSNLGKELQVTNDGNANIYISDCDISSCNGSGSGLFVITNCYIRGISGSGLFEITNSTYCDVQIDYFSGTAAEFEKYLETIYSNP